MGNWRNWLLLAVALLAPLTGSGCFINHTFVPFSMGFATPIPVPPWVTERMEEKYCYDRDHLTTILPPIRDGYPPPICMDPPDMAMVIRQMPKVRRGTAFIIEEFRDDIEVVTELLVDRLDPARFFPLIGPAQLHHCHWKCTIYYTETIESGYPFPFRCQKRRVEVIYIDKDHLHLCPGPNQLGIDSMTRDTSGPN
ncbi:MAG: hypothetical protein JNM56_28295 [Planctomycetia bacterium]|nr:hypothetical protein [Planctomycetia bacterium]